MAEYIEREALVRQIICDMAEFIGASDDVQKHDEQCNYAILCVESAPAADVVPVSELLALRDALYENDQITMRGLARLNMLIAKYGGYDHG